MVTGSPVAKIRTGPSAGNGSGTGWPIKCCNSAAGQTPAKAGGAARGGVLGGDVGGEFDAVVDCVLMLGGLGFGGVGLLGGETEAGDADGVVGGGSVGDEGPADGLT
jgi:hypothetical protein